MDKRELKNDDLHKIENIAYEIRRLSTEMITTANWGHIGGSFSVAEILAVLYGAFANIDPNNPNMENRDYIVLSKAHASPALYSVLAIRGFISFDELNEYCMLNGIEGHLDVSTPGVESSGGSLGLGLSYCVGLALALKMKESFSQKVYCILGDGELNEGQVWEALMSVSHYGLDNLIIIVDYNKIMAKGFVKNQMSVMPIVDKFNAFGLKTIEADGHSISDLYDSLYRAKYIYSGEKPVCIIAHTVKGKGVEQCEFNYKWHTHAPTVNKANEFLNELSARYNKNIIEYNQPKKNCVETLEQLINGENP